MNISATGWAEIVVAVLTALSAASVVVGWVVKHYLYELKPNGGSTLKDSVARLEKRVDDLYQLIIERL